MVTGHAIHFDWEIFNVSHPGYVVLIISGAHDIGALVSSSWQLYLDKVNTVYKSIPEMIPMVVKSPPSE